MSTEEYSKRMLTWFAELALRAQTVLYKPIETLTDQEKKRLGIHE